MEAGRILTGNTSRRARQICIDRLRSLLVVNGDISGNCRMFDFVPAAHGRILIPGRSRRDSGEQSPVLEITL
jgi:hypothetical protein